ncbi:MAG: magnesium transporter [Bdellovibrionales bacterium]|nr:magnesium transporter [Bdellovibrionales bacterium]
MSEEKVKMLATTVQKLMSRGARPNVIKILEKSHAADIAELLSVLSHEDRYDVFLMEPNEEKRAEILSHLEEEQQAEMLKVLSKKDVITLVSRMEKDDVADLLGSIPEDEADEILSSMVKEDSQEVAGLMGYPEDSAGGIMGSDYVAFKKDMTVKQVIESIQAEGQESKVTFYVYVVNDNEQLVGVSSLKQLLLSKADEVLKNIMFPEVISVNVETHQEEVSKVVEKYDFLSLPVVDGNNELVGLITVDDVIDVIREEAEEDLLAMGRAGWGLNVSTFEHFKARLPWLFFAYGGGAACFAIVYFLAALPAQAEKSLNEIWLVAAFIPVLLSMGATSGSQAATVAVGNLRASSYDSSKGRNQLLKEFRLAFSFALIFGLLSLLLGLVVTANKSLVLGLAGVMFVQILLALMMGATIPQAMKRLGFDPTVASVPLFTSIADVTAVILLVSLFLGI